MPQKYGKNFNGTLPAATAMHHALPLPIPSILLVATQTYSLLSNCLQNHTFVLQLCACCCPASLSCGANYMHNLGVSILVHYHSLREVYSLCMNAFLAVQPPASFIDTVLYTGFFHSRNYIMRVNSSTPTMLH